MDLVAKQASQNLAAAAVLLRSDPEPATPKENKLCQHLQTPLDGVVVQQAESSTSRWQETRARLPSGQLNAGPHAHWSNRSMRRTPTRPPNRRLAPTAVREARPWLAEVPRPALAPATSVGREGSTTRGAGATTTAVKTGVGA